MDSGEMVEPLQRGLRKEPLGPEAADRPPAPDGLRGRPRDARGAGGPASDLQRYISWLEVGDFPGVLAEMRKSRSDGSLPMTELALSTWDMAVCLRYQAFGEMDDAASRVRLVTERMPVSTRGRHMQRCGYQVALLEQPSRPGPPMWGWRLGRVVYREQRGINERAARWARDDLVARREGLIDAGIDFLTRRDLCPYARQPGPETRGLDLRRGPKSVGDLADAHRRLVHPNNGRLPDSVWRTFGSFEQLQVEVLRRLAETEPRADVPQRAGHLAAVEMAQRCLG